MILYPAYILKKGYISRILYLLIYILNKSDSTPRACPICPSLEFGPLWCTCVLALVEITGEACLLVLISGRSIISIASLMHEHKAFLRELSCSCWAERINSNSVRWNRFRYFEQLCNCLRNELTPFTNCLRRWCVHGHGGACRGQNGHEITHLIWKSYHIYWELHTHTHNNRPLTIDGRQVGGCS